MLAIILCIKTGYFAWYLLSYHKASIPTSITCQSKSSYNLVSGCDTVLEAKPKEKSLVFSVTSYQMNSQYYWIIKNKVTAV